MGRFRSDERKEKEKKEKEKETKRKREKGTISRVLNKEISNREPCPLQPTHALRSSHPTALGRQ